MSDTPEPVKDLEIHIHVRANRECPVHEVHFISSVQNYLRLKTFLHHSFMKAYKYGQDTESFTVTMVEEHDS